MAPINFEAGIIRATHVCSEANSVLARKHPVAAEDRGTADPRSNAGVSRVPSVYEEKPKVRRNVVDAVHALASPYEVGEQE